MKQFTLALALLACAFSTPEAYRDSIPERYKSIPVVLEDPVQVIVFDGTFQDTSEITYSPVFDISKLFVYRGFDSTGFLKEDTTFGQFRYMAYDISDSAAVTDSVNVQLTTQCSDYSTCGDPRKCPLTSDPWYTVHTDTLTDVSAASAPREKQRSLSAATVKTCRFLRVKGKEISTALQNKGTRLVGEWHRKRRMQ
jgi:hypothetical protein